MIETTIPGEMWSLVDSIVKVIIIPFAVYVIKSLQSLTQELRDLKVVLIGIDGKNGLRSRIIRTERKLEGKGMHDDEDS
jgi:hypothetical protein